MKRIQTGLLAILTMVLIALLLGASAIAAPRPNIIVILADDMGFSDIGCYGSEIATPNLDRLAANGLRFTQFYNTARCCPTRACLLTGLYPHQAGVGHMINDRKLEGYQGELNKSCVTIAQALKPSGYRNYAVGKWHVVRNLKADGPKYDWPLQRGFDRYYGTLTGAGNYFDPGTLTRDNTPISAFADPEYKPARFYYTDAITDHATRFIAEHQQKSPNQPFFMYVAYTAAHWPLHAKEEDIAKYKGRYDRGYEPIRLARFEKEKKLGLIDPGWTLSPMAGNWASVSTKAWESRCMEVYAAQVDCMDQGVGRITQELQKQGLLDNTLVLYLQDNGGCAEAMGRAGKVARQAQPTLPVIGPGELRADVRPTQTRAGYPMLSGPVVMPGPDDTFIAYGKSWANVSDTPFREYKHWVHEGGISTPLIAHWPTGIRAKGELRQQPGHLIDIMATCLDLAGASYPAAFNGNNITPLEGKSLAPAFENRAIERDAIFWEHEGNRAVRVGKWKLVAKSPAGKWELYDMEKDRTEMKDLATSEPERVKQMIAKWEEWAKRAHVIPWIWKPKYGAVAGAVAQQKDEPEVDERYDVGKTNFVLQAGDLLADEAAPKIGGRGFRVEAEIAQVGEGVIVAQGGTAAGFSLFIKDSKPCFAIRRANKLTVISASTAPTDKALTIAAELNPDGKMTLSVNGQVVASGKCAGTLNKTPVDGLSVGRDENAPVGPYAAPFAFMGNIGRVMLEIAPIDKTP